MMTCTRTKPKSEKTNRMKKATINLTILPDRKSMCTQMLFVCVSFVVAMDSSVRWIGYIHSKFHYIWWNIRASSENTSPSNNNGAHDCKESKRLHESTCRHRSVWHIPCQNRSIKQAKRIRWSPSSSLMRYQNALTRVLYLFSYISIRITFS